MTARAPVVRFGRPLCFICGEREVSVPLAGANQLCDDCKERGVVPPAPPDPDREPSLRWRLRRWLLKKLDAWPRAAPEPTTEWGRLRRDERIALTQEVARLRALEDRLTRYLAFADADRDRAAMGPRAAGFEDALGNVQRLVIDGHLDEMLADFAESGDELAAEYVREGP